MYVFIAALTPVPFFALTTAAGIAANLNFGVFITACHRWSITLRYGLEACNRYWLDWSESETMFIDKVVQLHYDHRYMRV